MSTKQSVAQLQIPTSLVSDDEIRSAARRLAEVGYEAHLASEQDRNHWSVHLRAARNAEAALAFLTILAQTEPRK